MRFSLLPLSISTLVSRKLSTIWFRTKAAGAQTERDIGSSTTLKVIAVSFPGFIAAIWQPSVRLRSDLLRRLFDEKVSKTVNTLRIVVLRRVLLWGSVGEDTLAALGHLPEYPTCSKAVGWFGIRCRVYLAWLIEPSLKNDSTSRNGLNFLPTGSGALRGCILFARQGGGMEAGGSQRAV